MTTKNCTYCAKQSYITIGACVGCIARYILRTVPHDNLAASIPKYAIKYNFEELDLKNEMTRQWHLLKNIKKL